MKAKKKKLKLLYQPLGNLQQFNFYILYISFYSSFEPFVYSVLNTCTHQGRRGKIQKYPHNSYLFDNAS